MKTRAVLVAALLLASNVPCLFGQDAGAKGSAKLDLTNPPVVSSSLTSEGVPITVTGVLAVQFGLLFPPAGISDYWKINSCDQGALIGPAGKDPFPLDHNRGKFIIEGAPNLSVQYSVSLVNNFSSAYLDMTVDASSLCPTSPQFLDVNGKLIVEVGATLQVLPGIPASAYNDAIIELTADYGGSPPNARVSSATGTIGSTVSVSIGASDSDGDGIPDNIDNCPTNFNPLQEDIDSDGLGDSCYLPEYLAPLIIVVREFVATIPALGELSLPGGDPGVNLCIYDPDSLLICADSASHLDTTTIINTIGDGANYFNITGEDSVVIDSPKTGTYIIEIIREFDDDPTKKFIAEIRVDGTVEHITGVMTVPPDDDTDTLFLETIPYVLGDADGSGFVTIGDATFIVKYVFQAGEVPPILGAADANCSGFPDIPDINIGDATFIVKYIFQSGLAPGCPPAQ